MGNARVLVVTKNVPWPANSGDKQRVLGVVRALRDLGEVTVVGFAGPHEDPAQAGYDGVTVRAVPRVTTSNRLARGLASRRSITAAKWWDERLAQAVATEVAAGVDVLVVESVQMAGYLPRHLPPGTVTVLDNHNVESLLTRRLARTTSSWRRVPLELEAAALTRMERRESTRFDVLAVVSDTDAQALARVVTHAEVVVLPNAVTDGITPLPPATTPTACFVGLLSWAPNADAAVAFTEQVWPSVRRAVPGARLLLVGRDPTPAVQALAADDVIVTGTVEELGPWYAESRVALAPLRAGGGSRLKILEALAWGRPVLATPIGVEGLDDLVGRGVVVADTPAALADELIGLLGDEARCAELGAAGARAVDDDHSWSSATAPLIRRLQELSRV